MPRWIRLLGQALVTIAVGGILLWTVDAAAVIDALRGAHPAWIGLAVLLLPLNLTLDGWVWARLLASARGQYPPRAIVRALFCGFALGFWTPARLGEFAGRAYSFDEAHRWAVTLSVLAQRVLDMVVGVGVGLVVLLWCAHAGLVPWTAAWHAAAGLGTGTVGLLTVVLVFPNRLYRGATTLGNRVTDLVPDVRLFSRLGPRQRLFALGGTVVRYVVFTGQFVCLTLALQPSLSGALVSLAVALTFFAKYLLPSLTLLNLGIREGAAVFFFGVLGLPSAVALSAALLLFALNVLGPAVLGLPTLPHLSVFSPSDTAPSPTPTS